MKNPRTIRAWAVAFWLAIWQLGSVILNRDSLLPLLVSPVQVLVRVAQLSVTTDFWASICFSLLRIATGFFLAAGLGILLAMLSARFHQVKDILAPVVLAVKTIPVASFIILVLILFSSRSLAALISFLMVLPIIYTNVLAGIEAADRQLLEMAEVFLIPVGRRIRYIYLPQVMPFSGRAVWSLWACVGSQASPRRSSGPPAAPSASICSRRKSIWICRTFSPGHW